ncbi:MAG: hypothetical protein WEC37_00565 [Anaerolineales bacterium]
MDKRIEGYTGLAHAARKVSRAQKHFRELQEQTDEFKKGEPFKVILEAGEIEPEELVGIVRQQKPLPEDTSVIVGDVLHNLRSAFDNLACQLVLENGKQVRRGPAGTSFPMFETEKEFDQNGPKRTEGMSPRAIEIVRSFQQFRTGSDTLTKLHALNIEDKHGLSILPAVSIARIEFPEQSQRDQLNTLGILNRRALYLPLRDGTRLFWMKPSEGKFQDDIKIRPLPQIELIFLQPEIVRGNPILDLLTDSIAAANYALNKFAPILV